jgi:hypothetical protein
MRPRLLVPCLLVSILNACADDAPPAALEVAPPASASPRCRVAPTDPGTATPSEHTLVVPAEHPTTTAIEGLVTFTGDRLNQKTELVYGLAEGYPRQVTITLGKSYVVKSGCQERFAQGSWTAITGRTGTAATVALVDGALTVELQEEGDGMVLVAGEIPGLPCGPEGEPGPAVVFEHLVELHVKRVAGLRLTHSTTGASACTDVLVLPSEHRLWLPQVLALDGAGQPFWPVNAKVPATLTLHSDGELAVGPEPWSFVAAAGAVAVEVDSSLSVEGLQRFDVVGPEALTSVQAELYLRRAVAKGDHSQIIENGKSYPVWFPDRSNGVDLRVETAMTTHGELCAKVPRGWFTVTSATPEQCAVKIEEDDAYAQGVTLATLQSLGECRLDVTVPGAPQRWTTSFHTTE